MATNQEPKGTAVPSQAASPPEPEPMVVVEFNGRCFQDAYATCPMRLVLVWSDEDFDEDDDSVVEVDGEFALVEEVDVLGRWDRRGHREDLEGRRH